MALARIKTWNPGDVLTAADLNAEFNNPLNNPISLISPTTGAINFQTSVAHTNLTPSAITASSGASGAALIATSSSVSAWVSIGGYSAVRNLVGTISSQTGVFTANQYVLQSSNTTRSFVLNSTASFTVNVGTAGPAANGRDVAASFSSTYVHWYVITTGQGSTAVAGVVSSTPPPTGPAFPTSYSAWGYLGGSNYTSASTTVGAAHRFRGSLATYDTRLATLNGGTAGVETAVSLATVIPANALKIYLEGLIANTTAGVGTFVLDIYHTSGQVNQFVQIGIPTANTTAFDTSLFVLPNTSQNVFYQLSSTATNASIYVLGYDMPNGGE